MKKLKLNDKQKNWLKLCFEIFIEISSYLLIIIATDIIREQFNLDNLNTYKLMTLVFMVMVFSEKTMTLFFKKEDSKGD